MPTPRPQWSVNLRVKCPDGNHERSETSGFKGREGSGTERVVQVKVIVSQESESQAWVVEYETTDSQSCNCRNEKEIQRREKIEGVYTCLQYCPRAIQVKQWVNITQKYDLFLTERIDKPHRGDSNEQDTKKYCSYYVVFSSQNTFTTTCPLISYLNPHVQ